MPLRKVIIWTRPHPTRNDVSGLALSLKLVVIFSARWMMIAERPVGIDFKLEGPLSRCNHVERSDILAFLLQRVQQLTYCKGGCSFA